MRIDSYDLRILGIGAKEGKILGALQGLSHASAAEAGRAASLPRTTALFILNKLLRRGLVERTAVKRHKEWRVAQSNELFKKLKRLAGLFGRQKRERGTIDDLSIGVEIVRGERKILETCRKIASLPKNSRISIVRGNHTVRNPALILFEKFFDDCYKKFKEKKIIVEELSSALNSDTDAFLLDNEAFMINFNQKVVIKINNVDLIDVLQRLFFLAASDNRKNSQNAKQI